MCFRFPWVRFLFIVSIPVDILFYGLVIRHDYVCYLNYLVFGKIVLCHYMWLILEKVTWAAENNLYYSVIVYIW